MKTIILLFGLTMVLLVEGKHMHHRSTVEDSLPETEKDSNESEKLADVDGMSIDAIRKFRPNRFVPINSIFSFKVYAPCEEGFERDLLGVCREVWD